MRARLGRGVRAAPCGRKGRGRPRSRGRSHGSRHPCGDHQRPHPSRWTQGSGPARLQPGRAVARVAQQPRGATTRDAYTKAAHLLLLKETLPAGRLALASEPAAHTARVVPHPFREKIREDRFDRQVMAVDAAATEPLGEEAPTGLRLPLPRLPADEPTPRSPRGAPAMERARIRPAVLPDGSGASRPEYRKLDLRGPCADPELQAAIARGAIRAPLRPASPFIDALRERVSFARRAGGRGARSGREAPAPATIRASGDLGRTGPVRTPGWTRHAGALQALAAPWTATWREPGGPVGGERKGIQRPPAQPRTVVPLKAS